MNSSSKDSGVSTSPSIDAGDNESAVFASRFPHAHIVSDVIAMAELLRLTASKLDRLAEYAPSYEGGSLRRAAHNELRRMVAEITGKVSL